MTVYATQTDVEAVLSQLGVTLRADDDEDGVSETANITYALQEASSQVDFYLLQRYTAAVLATSDYVIKATAALAACLLSRRRGNVVPGSIDAACEKYSKQLEQIATGQYQLPGAAMRDDPGITVTGLAVDLRYPHVPVRRTPIRSTGDPPPSTVKDYQIEDIELDWG